MKALTVSVALVAVGVLVAGPTFAQQQKTNAKSTAQCEQAAARTPQKIEGQVTSVDPNSGIVMVRANDGTMHQFQGSKETLAEYKVGDKLEANLRQPAPCS